MILDNNFAERFSNLLEELNISDYRLGKSVGIHATTIKSYKIGKTKPNNLKLDAIVRYLRINKEWLLTGQGERANYYSESLNESGIVRDLMDHIKFLQKQIEMLQNK